MILFISPPPDSYQTDLITSGEGNENDEKWYAIYLIRVSSSPLHLLHSTSSLFIHWRGASCWELRREELDAWGVIRDSDKSVTRDNGTTTSSIRNLPEIQHQVSNSVRLFLLLFHWQHLGLTNFNGPTDLNSRVKEWFRLWWWCRLVASAVIRCVLSDRVYNKFGDKS